MPLITYATRKQPNHGNDVKAKIQTFIEKLGQSDAVPGLHIEPINGSADPRARTGRVDIHLRAVLFRIDPPQGETHYIYAGTWPHDEGTEKAKKLTLHVNPVNGVLELRDAIAAQEPAEAPVAAPAPATPAVTKPLLTELGYFVTDLTDDFGSRRRSPTPPSRSRTRTLFSSTPRDSTHRGSRKSSCRWPRARHCT